MKCLEIIELRLAGGDVKELKSIINSIIEKARQEPDTDAVMAYRHFTLNSDFSIHLRHDTGKATPEGTGLGVQLAAALKDYAMVNHSIWIEFPAR